MEWWLALVLTFGCLITLIIIGVPVAFAFLLLDIIWVFMLWNGHAGLDLFIINVRESVTNFALLPVVLFMLMGEITFRAGIAPKMMDALDNWLGRIPGRLSLLAVIGGTLLSTLSGNSMASCAMLGSSLVPEMEKRGYKKTMTLGPILGSAGLAIMIPPSGLAVLFGAFAQVSIGRILIAIIIPGIIMAILYSAYIVIKCYRQPWLAPPYEAPKITLINKIVPTMKYIVPIALVVFLVTGVIFLGIATPTEAAATGSVGCFILAILYRKFNWTIAKETFTSTVNVTVMMLAIILGAGIFAQIMSFTGAIKGLTELVVSFPMQPIFVIIGMQILLLFMGMFVGAGAIIMITTPIFMPIIVGLGFDPVWFAVVYLLNMEMAATTPPYGLALFIMKSVAPSDTTMGDVYRSALPFLGCDLIAMILMFGFPQIVLWLPGQMR